MENTLQGTAGPPLAEQSAVQNTQSAAAVKLILVWLAVSIPMLWGIMRALENVQTIFP
ncbi:MAG TPA: hypothetical protein VK580_11135 [Steroidobacteraceae bacterium]|nr:hypothetical protein [Steroidobacteraceae bacterium]